MWIVDGQLILYNLVNSNKLGKFKEKGAFCCWYHIMENLGRRKWINLISPETPKPICIDKTYIYAYHIHIHVHIYIHTYREGFVPAILTALS